MDERASVNGAFYKGPLWKEHSAAMNERLIDHTNVLLLRPLRPATAIACLPAVDPVREAQGAGGVVMAQIFSVKPGQVESFAEKAQSVFAAYRAAGVREAGVLVTLDAPNNFPRLPFRTDGPYLVWLGIVQDTHTLESRFNPLAEHSSQSLFATDLLRSVPELVVLDPTTRS